MKGPADAAVRGTPYSLASEDGGRTFYLQGLLALREGRPHQAVALFQQARFRQPDHPAMRRNLLRALLAAGDFPHLLAELDTTLPDGDWELHFIKGCALNGTHQPQAARAAFHQAVTLQPNHAPAWLNYGNASADLDELEAAEVLYRVALSVDPCLAEAHASLGYVLTQLGRPAEAIAACLEAMRLRPGFVQAEWNRALATLMSGDLLNGFAQYECRKRHPAFAGDFPALPGPCWAGGNPAGQTILVRAEQGMGDTIQFARFLIVLRDMGAQPVVVCAPSLAPLFGRVPGVRAVTGEDPLPAYDAWADLMSLPWLMRTTLGTIPFPDGYLAPDEGRVAAWAEWLPSGPKIGLAFGGNPNNVRNARRSIPSPVLPAAHGINFVSLQHGVALPGLPDHTARMSDYAETAALIAHLDLVISADTSIAHLAGAMGKPAWVMLPSYAEWRWLRNRTDCPWYRSMRLFRQDQPGDWSDVLREVLAAAPTAVLGQGLM